MRAKEALRSFRSRSGAVRQRAASAVPRLETSKHMSTDESIGASQPGTNPEICVTETAVEQAGRDDEETKEVEDESLDDTERVRGSDGMEGSTESDSVFEIEELESLERDSLQT